MNFQSLLDDIAEEISRCPLEGVVADYIPGLETINPDHFGISMTMLSGDTYSAGEASTPFSIQSISKVFTLALVMAADGDDLWLRVSREPSGTAYNSLIQLEQERGIPRNPFINAGALVVTDRLLSLAGDSLRSVEELLFRESSHRIEVDHAIAASELATGHRNAALAYFLASHHNLANAVPDVLDAYSKQCALTMSCEDLSRAGSFLSRGGRGINGHHVLSGDHTRKLNAIMLTCGTYDAAGDLAYRVGLPCKSGVGGGILAVVPGICSIGVWGPKLGKSGNSSAGVAALAKLTTRTGWSIF